MFGAANRRGGRADRRLIVALFFLSVGALLVVELASNTRAQARDLFTLVSPRKMAGSTTTPARTRQIQRRATTAAVDLIRIDVSALRETTTQMRMLSGKVLKFERENVVSRGDNDFTWIGNLAGIAGGATLVVRGGNVTGTINDGAYLHRIEPVGDGLHALIRVDVSRFPADHPPGFERKRRHSQLNQPTTIPPHVGAAPAPAGPIEIDVLVA